MRGLAVEKDPSVGWGQSSSSPGKGAWVGEAGKGLLGDLLQGSEPGGPVAASGFVPQHMLHGVQ